MTSASSSATIWASSPRVHPGVDELLGNRQPKLLQAQRLAAHAGELGELAERGAPPEPKGAFEQRDLLGTRCGVSEVVEPGRVQLDEAHVDRVADATGSDDLVRHQSASQP